MVLLPILFCLVTNFGLRFSAIYFVYVNEINEKNDVECCIFLCVICFLRHMLLPNWLVGEALKKVP